MCCTETFMNDVYKECLSKLFEKDENGELLTHFNATLNVLLLFTLCSTPHIIIGFVQDCEQCRAPYLWRDRSHGLRWKKDSFCLRHRSGYSSHPPCLFVLNLSSAILVPYSILNLSSCIVTKSISGVGGTSAWKMSVMEPHNSYAIFWEIVNQGKVIPPGTPSIA